MCGRELYPELRLLLCLRRRIGLGRVGAGIAGLGLRRRILGLWLRRIAGLRLRWRIPTVRRRLR